MQVDDLLFLGPFNVHKHTAEAEYAFFQRCRLLRDLAGLSWGIPARFALDHDVEVE